MEFGRWPNPPGWDLPTQDQYEGFVDWGSALEVLSAESSITSGYVPFPELSATDCLSTPSAIPVFDSSLTQPSSTLPSFSSSPDTTGEAEAFLPLLETPNEYFRDATELHNRLPQPKFEKCEHCNKLFSSKGLKDHQKPTRETCTPCCTLSFPCSTPGDPGCEKVFKDLRSRLRHRMKSCKHFSSNSAFKCCCGRTVKRWDQFKKRHAECKAKSPDHHYRCDCAKALEFTDFQGLEEHQISNMGKKGRPPTRRGVD